MVLAMSEANKGQVGGSHYKADFQHWDWTELCHLGYMEGQITRYVLRWYKKDGIQDLDKALHYVEKLMEMHRHTGRTNPRFMRNIQNKDLVDHYTQRMFDQALTPLAERCIIEYVRDWSTMDHLENIRICIAALIKDKQT